jgi:hypothetical protein
MKYILRFFFILLILVIAGITLLWINAPRICSYFLTQNLGSPVRVEKVEISLHSIELKDFTVENPHFSRTKYALICDRIHVNFLIKELFQKAPKIDSIMVDNMLVNVELYDTKGEVHNWKMIVANVPKTEEGKKTNFEIRKVTIEHLSSNLIPAKEALKPLPPMEHVVLKNITEENGLPLDKIQKALYEAVLQEIFKQKVLAFLQKGLLEKFIPKFF